MFDRRLSLAIDSIYDELDHLSYAPGCWARVRRVYLRWKLRRLERMIP